jgi:hypothetical protein
MQPPPPGQPPYGQPQQQYGQPPYGQPPGNAPYGMPAQPPPGNGWGVAALVTGLVGLCLPFVGGLLAIVFGIVGIKRAGKTHTGKGMSIAGLILGLASLALWGLFGGALLALFKGTEVNRDIARQFITDLHAQNTAAAANAVDPAQVTDDELKALADRDQRRRRDQGHHQHRRQRERRRQHRHRGAGRRGRHVHGRQVAEVRRPPGEGRRPVEDRRRATGTVVTAARRAHHARRDRVTA